MNLSKSEFALVGDVSNFPISVDVANCIEKLQREFLWSSLGEESQFHFGKMD